MEQRRTTDLIEPKDVRLVVGDESDLYNPFNPETEFSAHVKEYIQSKAAGVDPGQSINLHVISSEKLDEDKFRTAVSNWIEEEKALFKKKERETKRMLVGLLILGSVFIVLSIALQKQFEVLKYSLLPIMGSLALSKATGTLIIDMPTVRAQRMMISEMEKHNVITFEYVHEDNTSPDKELV